MVRPSNNAEEDDSLVVHPATQAAPPIASSDEAEQQLEEHENESEEDEDQSQSISSSQKLWPVRAILDERGNKYLLAWEGTDEHGNEYDPTWESKDNATDALVREWNELKKAKRLAKREGKQKKGRGRPRKNVISDVKAESSPQLESTGDPEQPTPSIPRAASTPSIPSASIASDVKEKRKLSLPVEKQLQKKRSRILVPTVEIIVPSTSRAPLASTSAPRKKQVASEAPKRTSSPQEVRDTVVPDSQNAALTVDDSDSEAAEEQSERDEAEGSMVDDSAIDHRDTPLSQEAVPVVREREVIIVPSSDDDSDVDIVQHQLRPPTAAAAIVGRPLGPVPFPRTHAFTHVLPSSQFDADPIEDPDSSPACVPLGPSRVAFQPQQAVPAPAPAPAARAKPQLELITTEKRVPSPSPSASVSDENSFNDSYVSQAVAAGTGPLGRRNFAGPFSTVVVRSAGASGAPSRMGAASPAPFVKTPFGRAPTPTNDGDDGDAPYNGGGAVAFPRVASQPRSVTSSRPASQVPSTQSDYDQTFPALDTSALDQVMQPFDTAAAGPSDAGEGSAGNGSGDSNGHQSSSNGGSSSQQQQQQQSYQQQQQSYHQANGVPAPAPYYSSTPYGAPYGGPPGGYGSFPAFGPPSSHASAHPSSKREADVDPNEDIALKRSRPNQSTSGPEPIRHQPSPAYQVPPYRPPPQQQYQPSTSMHSYPRGVPPTLPPISSFAPPARHLPSTALPPIQSRPSPVQQPQTLPSMSTTKPLDHSSRPPPHIPIPNYASSSNLPLPAFSPTLSRVQNTDPMIQAMPGSGLSSPPMSATASGGANAATSAPLANRQRSMSPSSALKSPNLRASAAVSRNASPAPNGGSQLDGLVQLVKNSPHIVETDATKSEMEKFIREPKAYAAGDGPLLKSAYWAFELRRLSQDNVDKTDFIIIHSQAGTYQLKRVPSASAQFDFARSLAHTSTSTRGGTPVVDAGPPAPKTMTREELEKEVESLRAANKELATLKALAAETTKLRTEVEKLTKTNKQLLNSKETAQSDFAYMQAQYSEASTAAVARAREATVAEDEAARLKMLLDTGLKQRDLISKGENRALKHELDRLKSEVHLLKAESRRTVDVRDKAAKWDYYLAKKEHEEEMAKGEVDGDETSSEEGGDDDDREEESADSQVVGDALVPIKNDEADTTMATETSFAPEPSTIDDSIVQPSSTSSSSNQPFVCEWRIGSAVEAQPCGAVVASRQALDEHLQGHIPPSQPEDISVDTSADVPSSDVPSAPAPAVVATVPSAPLVPAPTDAA